MDNPNRVLLLITKPPFGTEHGRVSSYGGGQDAGSEASSIYSHRKESDNPSGWTKAHPYGGVYSHQNRPDILMET